MCVLQHRPVSSVRCVGAESCAVSCCTEGHQYSHMAAKRKQSPRAAALADARRRPGHPRAEGRARWAPPTCSERTDIWTARRYMRHAHGLPTERRAAPESARPARTITRCARPRSTIAALCAHAAEAPPLAPLVGVLEDAADVDGVEVEEPAAHAKRALDLRVPMHPQGGGQPQASARRAAYGAGRRRRRRSPAVTRAHRVGGHGRGG